MTPLRQRMLEDMQVRNLSPRTQRAYVENVARFARHVGRSPAVLGPKETRAYLKPRPLPVVLSLAEERQFFLTASPRSSIAPS